MKLSRKWHDQSHGRPVSRQTSRATCHPAIMRDWCYDPAQLVVRSCTTCLQPLVVCNRRSRVLNMIIDLAATKIYSYDHPRLLRSIARFVSDLSPSHTAVATMSRPVYDHKIRQIAAKSLKISYILGRKNLHIKNLMNIWLRINLKTIGYEVMTLYS